MNSSLNCNKHSLQPSMLSHFIFGKYSRVDYTGTDQEPSINGYFPFLSSVYSPGGKSRPGGHSSVTKVIRTWGQLPAEDTSFKQIPQTGTGFIWFWSTIEIYILDFSSLNPIRKVGSHKVRVQQGHLFPITLHFCLKLYDFWESFFQGYGCPFRSMFCPFQAPSPWKSFYGRPRPQDLTLSYSTLRELLTSIPMCHQKEQCFIAYVGLTDFILAELGFAGKCREEIGGVEVWVRMSGGGRGWYDCLESGRILKSNQSRSPAYSAARDTY